MNQLTKIANKHNSSKGTVGTINTSFTELYYDYFNPLKNKKLNILEIGVGRGGSLKLWKEFFKNRENTTLNYLQNRPLKSFYSSNERDIDSLVKNIEILTKDNCHITSIIKKI